MQHTNGRWHLEESERLTSQTIFDIEKMRYDLPPVIDLRKYTNYYFDSMNGNDDFDGTTPAQAKKSLDSLKRLIKRHEHIRVLFKRGSIFNGNLVIENIHSSSDYPLIIDCYGEDAKLPLIVGDESVVHIKESHVRVAHLEIMGPRAYRGIHITPTKKGVLENIVISDCYIHDINWVWTYEQDSKDLNPDEINIEKVCPTFEEDLTTKGRYHYRYYGGIIAHNEVGPSYFKNIWIMNNIVKNVARTGITIYSKWTNKPGVGYGYNEWVSYDFVNDIDKSLGYFGSLNLYCLNNYVECAAADGIVISSAENVVVRGNTSYYANYLGRTGYWNGGIWVYNVKNCLFELNEAAYTYKRHGVEDAQGFDLDNCCENVVMQYNYAHHNEGGGLLCCNLKTTVTQRDANGEIIFGEDNKPRTDFMVGKWVNNYIYKNYFLHNGILLDQTRSAFLTIAREVTHSTFKENIVIIDEKIDGQSIIHTEDLSTVCYDLKFEGNVFYAPKISHATFRINMMIDSTFVNNIYQNVNSIDQKVTKSKSVELNHEHWFELDLTHQQDKDIFTRKINAKKNLQEFGQYITNGGIIL